METIRGPMPANPAAALPSVGVPVDRRTLAKRLWRGTAADGREFGFQLERPLAPGDVVWATDAVRYVIEQAPEPVLEIPLPTAPDEAAAVGWAVGNLHFPIEAQARRMLAPDDPALRQSLARAGIPFAPVDAVFRPHRFAAAAKPHAHGSSTPADDVPAAEPRYRFVARNSPAHG